MLKKLVSVGAFIDTETLDLHHEMENGDVENPSINFADVHDEWISSLSTEDMIVLHESILNVISAHDSVDEKGKGN
jgi:hypothetical protein